MCSQIGFVWCEGARVRALYKLDWPRVLFDTRRIVSRTKTYVRVHVAEPDDVDNNSFIY